MRTPHRVLRRRAGAAIPGTFATPVSADPEMISHYGKVTSSASAAAPATQLTAAALRERVAARPRARGWIHLYSAIGAAAVGIVLVVMAAATVSGEAAV